jgi:hypothetical protein
MAIIALSCCLGLSIASSWVLAFSSSYEASYARSNMPKYSLLFFSLIMTMLVGGSFSKQFVYA